MDKITKTLILIIGAGMLLNFLKEKLFNKEKSEIIIAGHHVNKEPCLRAMNELFGRGIDSSRMCDCLIPKFYDLVKDDHSKVEKFQEIGFFKLEGALYDSSMFL